MTRALNRIRTIGVVGLALAGLLLGGPPSSRADERREMGRSTSDLPPMEGPTAELICAPISESDTSTMHKIDSFGYGKPNQSRLWYNGLAGRWDGLVPRNDGGESGSDHYIVTDLTGTPVFTSLEAETRNEARPDVHWDDSAMKLYVLGSHFETPKIWQFVYLPFAGVYAVNPDVDGVAVPGVEHSAEIGENEPASLYLSPDGDLWVSVMRAGFLGVQHSEDGGQTWLPQPVVLDDEVAVGVTTWTHFTDGAHTYVGLFAGENGEDGHPVAGYFYWYVDQEADPSLLSNWTDESPNIPGAFGGESSDDHVNAARDSEGNQYFVVKTEAGGPTDPSIKLFRRTTHGAWTQYRIVDDEEIPSRTRPSVIVDDQNGYLFVFVTETGGGDGVRKRVPLEMPELLANAPFVKIFTEHGARFDDIIAPHQNVDSDSGIAVLAHDERGGVVWIGSEALPESGPADPVAVADIGTLNEGESLDVPAPGVLTNDSDPQDDPLIALLVSGPSHGSLTLHADGSYLYIHDGSETVADSFAYEAAEPGGGVSNTVLVQLTVTPLDDAPTVLDDAYRLDQGGTLTVDGPGVLANDADAEGTPLTATLIDEPDHGSVTLHPDGSFVYTHESGESTDDSFTYVAEDATGQVSTEATVILDVVAIIGMRIVGSDTQTLSELDEIGYGKPNQTRIWYNGAAERWDALIPKDDGGASGSNHYVLLDVPGAQIFTGVQVEPRNDARPGIFWDEERQSLHVLSSHNTATRVWRLDYDLATDSYAIDPVVDAVAVPGLVHRDENNPASLYVSPNGHVWAAVLRDDALEVQHSADRGATWLPVPILLNDDGLFGVTDWSHFDRDDRTWVGLFAAEEGDRRMASRNSYRYIDQDADPAILENWVDETAGMPAPMGQEAADNHVSAARDALGNQYFVVRTEPLLPSDPLIKLYRRTPEGVWSQHLVTRFDEVPSQTRPSLVIDDANAEIRVFSTDTGGGVGQRRRARLDDLDALADALPLTMLQSLADLFDDILTPRGAVTPTSGLVILGHSETNRLVWAATETIGEDLCVTVQGGTPQSLAQTIPLTGEPGTLQARIFRPETGRQTGACPLITILPALEATIEDVTWAAELLAADGYVVILTQPAEATAEAFDLAARTGIDFMLSTGNPWLEATDTGRIGGIGGPMGGSALTLTQEIDIRLDAIVEWDNLSMSETGDAGSPICDLTAGPARTPFVPAMGQASDGCNQGPDEKKTGYDWWRVSDVETMQLVFAGSDGSWWGATGTSAQHDRIHHYTLAWLDRWLKSDPTAKDRLMAVEVAEEPVVTLLDDYYRSGIYFDGLDCPDFRALASGAPEICTSGVDDNCDRLIDCQDPIGCPPGIGEAPGEVTGVVFGEGGTTLEWQPSFDADVYDVLFGDLGELRLDGGFDRAECLAWREPAAPLAVEDVPPPGQAWYYLVRGKTDPCLLGSWGSATRDLATGTCP